jgi:hypothetical protein
MVYNLWLFFLAGYLRLYRSGYGIQRENVYKETQVSSGAGPLYKFVKAGELRVTRKVQPGNLAYSLRLPFMAC